MGFNHVLTMLSIPWMTTRPPRKETREVAPILRVGQELQQWQNQQKQLWQSQSAASDIASQVQQLQVREPRPQSAEQLVLQDLADHESWKCGIVVFLVPESCQVWDCNSTRRWCRSDSVNKNEQLDDAILCNRAAPFHVAWR